MMFFTFKIDGVVDRDAFAKQWEFERASDEWPPFDFTWAGNILRARTDSHNVPEAQLRKKLNLALGHQGRRLID